MTATPIPRTVAMTVYGDLEISTLTELPGGRQPIQTYVIPPEQPKFLDRAWGRIRDEVEAGHQAFVVCPRITSDSDAGGGAEPAEPPPDSGNDAPNPGAAVEDVLPELREGPLKGLRVEALHGKMHADDKDAVMRRFAAGELDVLVATTVIEVGIDVPNATVMVVLDADRFGVSQLHQLRGRVGRGSVASWCLLQTSAPDGTPARDRLTAVESTLDGAELALVDLAQRREGNVLGASQSGRRTRLRLLDLLRHGTIIREAREDAIDVVAADPNLAELPGLRRALAATLDEAEAAFLQKG
jgi:ATP-dependent DNA helicase RecG